MSARKQKTLNILMFKIFEAQSDWDDNIKSIGAHLKCMELINRQLHTDRRKLVKALSHARF
jgi:hypothetical protein